MPAGRAPGPTDRSMPSGPPTEREQGARAKPAFDPLDPNPDTNPQLMKKGLVGNDMPTAVGMVVDPRGVPPPPPGKPDAQGPTAAGAGATVSAGPRKPQKARTALSAEMRQFVPSALLVRRNLPKRVIKPRRTPKAAKPTPQASKKTTQQAYDVFMSEMESLGALDEDE